MVGEAAVVTNLGEALVGADDEVAGFLHAEVAQVFFWGHVEAGFELSQKAAEGKVGGAGECADGDVFAEVFVE